MPGARGANSKVATTVLASLEHATRPRQLECLMNLSRFAARSPHIPTMYGTTRHEAFHLQLKAFFRNVMFQTKRNATVVAQVATLSKLIAACIRKADLIANHFEFECLRLASVVLFSSTQPWVPKFNHGTTSDPSVDTALLPPTASRPGRKRRIAQGNPNPKRSCKRPASSSCKRPASS